jgi:hypothetical protein
MLSNQNTLNIRSSNLNPNSQIKYLSKIPPFGYLLIPFEFNKTDFLTNRSDTIKITLGNSSMQKEILVLPFFATKMFIAGGLLIAYFIFIISLATYVYRRISFFRQKK